MLYKKIHRQFVREFRIGRKYGFSGSNIQHRVNYKPSVGRDFIWINELILIYFSSGRIQYKDKIIWLN